MAWPGRKSVVSVTWAALLGAAIVAHAQTQPPRAEKVTFESDGLTLVGYLYRPEGTGPWPALVWNHGSEKDPSAGPQFGTIAATFVPDGYVVFAPVRRGHGESQGEYIVNRLKLTARTQGRSAAARLAAELLATEQFRDQLSGLVYVAKLPSVDSDRIVVAGCSFGGIETLLGAIEGVGYRAAVSISPGALSWDQSEPLRSLLTQTIRRVDIPVLLIQPAKDESLAPSRVLGAEAARLRKPLTTRIYPATGSEKEQGHCFGGARGMHVWAQDAKAFFRASLAP
jgi:dienelactone hydrolase